MEHETEIRVIPGLHVLGTLGFRVERVRGPRVSGVRLEASG